MTPAGVLGEPAPGPYTQGGTATNTPGTPIKSQIVGLVFETNTITAKAGEKVTIDFTNCSFAHAFVSPSLGVDTKVDIPAGSPLTEVSFTAPTTPGKYMFWCPVTPPGGLSHAARGETGIVIVQ